MIAVGGLIGVGTVEAVPVLLWAVAGAVLGDWLSYGIGRRIGPTVYRRWPLNRHRALVARARLFFRKFGFASVFLGRFLGPVRSTIPLVAGVMQMDRRSFQIANVGSALIWVPAMFAPGYLAARNLEALEAMLESHAMGLAAAGALLGLGVVLFGYRLYRKKRERRRTHRLRLTPRSAD